MIERNKHGRGRRPHQKGEPRCTVTLHENTDPESVGEFSEDTFEDGMHRRIAAAKAIASRAWPGRRWIVDANKRPNRLCEVFVDPRCSVRRYEHRSARKSLPDFGVDARPIDAATKRAVKSMAELVCDRHRGPTP